MKRLLPFLLIAFVSLFATSAYSQVRVHATINLPLPPLPPIPHVRVYAQSAPRVIYQDNCQPASPYYDGYGRERVIATEPSYGYGGYYSDRDYRYRRSYGDRDDYRRHESREHRDHDRGYRRGW